jgi:hypothetical protein
MNEGQVESGEESHAGLRIEDERRVTCFVSFLLRRVTIDDGTRNEKKEMVHTVRVALYMATSIVFIFVLRRICETTDF